MEKQMAYSLLTLKAVSEEQRTFSGIATTPEMDRMGDIVEPKGLSFKNPLPLLMFHDSRLPVGTAKFEKPTDEGIPFTASLPTISEPGTLRDRIEEAWQSVKHKLIRGVSIGFSPKEYSFMDDGGVHYLTGEVLELSLAVIPANASATIQTIKSMEAQMRRSRGITLAPVPVVRPGSVSLK
jgi:HK97 family phage prohead protease